MHLSLESDYMDLKHMYSTCQHTSEKKTCNPKPVVEQDLQHCIPSLSVQPHFSKMV